MSRTKVTFVLCVILGVLSAGCGKKVEEVSANTGPPVAQVEPDMDASNFKVDHPEQYPLATAGMRSAAAELNATGVVSPDPSRQVPVASLSTGRVVEIDAHVGDEVKKGQLLFKVRSTDIASAYSDYQKAVKNEKLAVDSERLAKLQQNRAKLLFDSGAIAKSALEIADNSDVAALTVVDNARVDVETAAERLKLLGATDLNQPTGIVPTYAPVAGVITDQQITDSSGVQALGAPNPFTISDMSHVWIVCDVYENNLSQVRIGEYVDIRLNAYPDRVMKAKISNIGQIMDPNLHTVKVRLEVENPGIMRLGMFVAATFHGAQVQRATVPVNAVLHLHDRDWVYTPGGDAHFKRVEVVSGDTLPGGLMEIKSGIKAGDMVVSNALVLQSTVEQ